MFLSFLGFFIGFFWEVNLINGIFFRIYILNFVNNFGIFREFLNFIYEYNFYFGVCLRINDIVLIKYFIFFVFVYVYINYYVKYDFERLCKFKRLKMLIYI